MYYNFQLARSAVYEFKVIFLSNMPSLGMNSFPSSWRSPERIWLSPLKSIAGLTPQIQERRCECWTFCGTSWFLSVCFSYDPSKNPLSCEDYLVTNVPELKFNFLATDGTYGVLISNLSHKSHSCLFLSLLGLKIQARRLANYPKRMMATDHHEKFLIKPQQ